jgi:hypothetical protein
MSNSSTRLRSKVQPITCTNATRVDQRSSRSCAFRGNGVGQPLGGARTSPAGDDSPRFGREEILGPSCVHITPVLGHPAPELQPGPQPSPRQTASAPPSLPHPHDHQASTRRQKAHSHGCGGRWRSTHHSRRSSRPACNDSLNSCAANAYLVSQLEQPVAANITQMC